MEAITLRVDKKAGCMYDRQRTGRLICIRWFLETAENRPDAVVHVCSCCICVAVVRRLVC